MRYVRSLVQAAVSAYALGACGSGGPEPPPPTASITGTVQNESTADPLAGATVSAGNRQATSDANGGFVLDSVPVGPSVTIRSQRTGFVAYTAVIPVEEGGNIHDIQMTRQDLYELSGVAVYVRPDISAVRGVILHLGGEDTRGVATGVCPPALDPAICASQQQMRQHYLVLAALGKEW